MLISEQEAKEKQCPYGALNALAMARDGKSLANWPGMIMCDGSDCMAWRWGDEIEVGKERSSLLGYCGLAGKPVTPITLGSYPVKD